MSYERPPSDREASPPGVPGWVKVLAVVVLVLVAIVVLAMVLGLGGEHGPGRHG